jgi:hypothetical protein
MSCRRAVFPLVLVMAGCTSTGMPSPPPTARALATASPVLASPSASSAEAPSPTAEPAGTDAAEGPPAAQLAAEGGDPVTGQLGTYIWGDGGSDSPWLPGARIAVGAGEPLTVTFRSSAAVATWRARSVPSSADGPAGARLLGEGTGGPAFGAPPAGSWTVEVHVVFDGGVGDASYFWRLEVT